MATYETVNLKQDEEYKGVFILELNRPKSLNAMTTQMAEDIIDCLQSLTYTEDIRILILTGHGDRGFCTGADLKERNGMTENGWKQQHDIFENAARRLRDFHFPTIAAINGYALAGGLELALACDLRVVASHAKLGLTEAKIGIIPGLGGTQLLPRTIPLGLAKEYLFRGNHISADRAYALGLANEVVELRNLMSTSIEIADEIAKNAPLSLQAIKKSINHGLQTDLTTALNIELSHYYTCANSEDRLEGVKAFNEKRQPHWQGK